jgi:uncharacterized protein (TIGR04255 family)
MPPQIVWRFNEEGGHWRVSLAPDFVAIETTKYQSRDDFFARFGTIVSALTEHFGPRIVDRIGVRYIDRITGQAIQEIKDLVRPEVLGVIGTAAGESARHSVCESLFTIPESPAQLLARWGLLPVGGTVDPAAIEPLQEESWILDLDMFRAEARSFDPNEVLVEARSFAERIYTVFRWAVTDKFLRLYGGEV